jgi:hypothetical protein
MASTLYKKTEQFVVNAFTKADKPTDVIHARRTAYWIKKLKPKADEALLIAGLTHDIERAFYGDWKKGSDNPRLLKKHQNLSATEIEKFLEKEGAEKNIIKRVKILVSHHEEGGDEDQNILCDADCLAYFEEKALRNAKKYKKEGRPQEMKKKLDYVCSRIHSLKAKKIVNKRYNKAMDELNEK